MYYTYRETETTKQDLAIELKEVAYSSCSLEKSVS